MNLILPSPPISFKPFHHRIRLETQSRAAALEVKNNIDSNSDFNKTTKTGVIIVGAGLAGLAAATRLKSENIPYVVVEASDAVGGRVRTDIVDGFLLDRGFQIFITAYPEAKRILDYKDLCLEKFYSGAKVYLNDGEFHTVADPLRHFWDALATLSLTHPIGSPIDKLLVGLTRIKLLTRSNEEILSSPTEVSIMSLLQKTGFSDSIIDRFFRPFFGGIFFDTNLETSSRLFDFIFRCLALGENTLPAKGISAIPEQLASNLPTNSVLLNSKVVAINNDSVTLQSGEILESEFGVIVAVEQPEAQKLLPVVAVVVPENLRRIRSTVCLYFSADDAPVREPVLFLNGSGSGIINNMFFPTNVAPSYAPPGKTLISVSLVGSHDLISDEDLTAQVLQELSGWFGDSVVRRWKHLRTYRVKFAQPNQCPPTNFIKDPKLANTNSVYMCGDHWSSATFDGALLSGRRAAEALIRDKP